MKPLQFSFEELPDDSVKFKKQEPANKAEPQVPTYGLSYGGQPLQPSQYPLISCIMPTAGRADYVARAIEMFLQQDYPNKELVIVYNQPSDLPAMEYPQSVRPIYARTTIIGAKRNEACRHSQGAIIAHWDDDDIYNKDRLIVQAMPILTGEADITGMKNFLFFNAANSIAYQPTPLLFSRMFTGSFATGTLMFNKLVWSTVTMYPNLTEAEDTGFLARAVKKGARAKAVDGLNSFVYVRHSGNTWQFDQTSFTRDPGWLPAGLPEWAQQFVPGYRSPRVPYVHSAYQPYELEELMFKNKRRQATGVEDAPEQEDGRSVPDGATGNYPLISCIMPTANRAAYVAGSVGYFLAQDYPNKELIIVYNKDTDLPAMDYPPSVKLLRVGTRIIGAKRNEGCRVAQGAIFAQWDDDDIYSTRRLTAQALPIIEGRADMTGVRNFIFYEVNTGMCYMPTEELFNQAFQCNVASGTLVFNRQLWDKVANYPNLKAGEDFGFLCRIEKSGAKIASVDGFNLFVYTRHTSNTWRFEPDNFRKYSSWLPANLPAWARKFVPYYQQIAIEQINDRTKKELPVLH